MCFFCEGGRVFISDKEPWLQEPCPNCGGRVLFINEKEEDVLKRLKEPAQLSFNFPKGD
jgi:hypothetical protein